MQTKVSFPSAIFLSGVALVTTACTPQQPTTVIDTHIHLYDTNRPGGVPWPSKEQAAIYRPVLPGEFKGIAKANGVGAAVIVEASPLLGDNDWVLGVTEREPMFVAVVASLRPDAPDFRQQLDQLCQDPRFVGIRPRVDQPSSPLEPGYISGLSLLSERKKTLDLLAHTFSLSDVAKLAGELPELHIVVNHLAGVTIDGGPPPEAWKREIALLAAHPNVYCKMSGIFQQTKTSSAPLSPAFYRPVFDAVWAAFGEDRILYGSNWPVTNLAGDYHSQFEIISDYVAEKGAVAKDKVFQRNAVEAYRLKLP